MSYLQEETLRLTEKLRTNGGIVNVFNNIFKGSDFLHVIQRADIKPNDVVLMISLDSTQLYKSKSSNCWIYIWVIINHSPDRRYKKQFVLPGGYIPGPKTPKNINSFIFPGMHHLAALQNEGLRIWDAWHNIVFISNPFLIFVTANGHRLMYFDGMVGHSRKNGCWLYCGLLGH